MYFIPALDIKDGKCVRLHKGNMLNCKVYSSNPLDIIKDFKLSCDDWLHIIDLDGAVCGSPKNLEIIHKLVSNLDCNIQVGGGIRNINTVKNYLEMGVNKVILGTSVLENPDLINEISTYYPGKIAISIDTLNGMVLTKGWTSTTNMSYEKVLDLLSNLNISSIIWTDIDRDGTMHGINIKGLERVISNSKIPVIVSGGVSNILDLINLKNNFSDKLAGVICGKALYEGVISLDVAMRIIQDKWLA